MFKQGLLIVSTILLFQSITSANPSGNVSKYAATARVKLDSMWVDYDVKEGGVLGMMIHFEFTAYNLKDKEGFRAIYFEYDDEEGGVLKDKNNKLSVRLVMLPYTKVFVRATQQPYIMISRFSCLMKNWTLLPDHTF